MFFHICYIGTTQVHMSKQMYEYTNPTHLPLPQLFYESAMEVYEYDKMNQYVVSVPLIPLSASPFPIEECAKMSR